MDTEKESLKPDHLVQEAFGREKAEQKKTELNLVLQIEGGRDGLRQREATQTETDAWVRADILLDQLKQQLVPG